MEAHKNAWGYERQPKAADRIRDVPTASPQPAGESVPVSKPAAEPVAVKQPAKAIPEGALAALLAKLKTGEAELTAEVEAELKKLGLK